MGTAATTPPTSANGDPQPSSSSSQLNEMDGVIPRAVQDLFANIMSQCDNNATVELSFLEVYNEEIRDLMNPAMENTSGKPSSSAGAPDLRIRETLNGEVYVRGLQSRMVHTPAEIGQCMQEASGRRVVASTKMNATSSRSHAICVLKIQGVLDDGSTKFQSKLTLVDLAGSERIKKTQAKGDRAQEGININKGLFTLGQCISALSEQRPRYKRKPPFRDSKLTRLLQDSLGGNSRTIMIACCSPADFNVEETMNTLRYATQARNIQTTATANVVQTISQEEALKLQRENTLLKQQVDELQETIRKLTEDVTEEDMHRSMAMIHAEQERSIRAGRTVMAHDNDDFVSPLRDPKTIGNQQQRLPRPPISPEAEIPPIHNATSSDDDDDHHLIHASSTDEDEYIDDSDDDAVQSESGDDVAPLEPKKNKGMSLDAHFGSQLSDPELQSNNHNKSEDEKSLALEEVLPGLHKHSGTTDRSVVSHKSHQELEDENEYLRSKLRQTNKDMHASVKQSAIELPALRARVEMLEEELNNSMIIENETEELRRELEEAKADKTSAQLAAKQLADFMEQQKKEFGFRGDELEKKRLWYFHKRLDEKWVEFVVIMLGSFKEQMRLLGDYFALVVTVVESPDILTMLGPQGGKRQGGWFGGFNRQQQEKAATEEANLRNTLLTEHIKFFNSRLLEIEDEINNRSESVDTILDDVGRERFEIESELEETEFVRDFFSKKGEKLLKDLTQLMTGPLFSTPKLQESMANVAANSSRRF